MPHAEENMSGPLTNGDKTSSQFLSVSTILSAKQHSYPHHPTQLTSTQHLVSYPVVSDSISTIESNPYGKKAISMAASANENLVQPVLRTPYAQKPYAYVSPYVHRADELADSSLAKVDARFPIVKEKTSSIKDALFAYVHAPFVAASRGRDYVYGTWGQEYKKCGGDGVVAGGKAVITTSLVVTSETLTWISEFLSKKKGEAENVVKKNA